MSELTLEELQTKLAETNNPVNRGILEKQILKKQAESKAMQGDESAVLVNALYKVLEQQSGNFASPVAGAVSQADVDKAVQTALATRKIALNDLDPMLQSYLTQQAKVQLEIISLTQGKNVGKKMSKQQLEDPLFQKILTDSVAMNNIYLYGVAGSGKTFYAETLASTLNYDYIEINCNQYTSPIEIIGGQTIRGYQEGKLVRAWANLSEDGKTPSNKRGAVLCIDEMPKIDPNTAGLFNSALAKVKNISYDDATGQITYPTIENSRGEKFPKGGVNQGHLIIIATGNLRLNELSTEYEANFKQDLSLQDRFAGSTYRVEHNYKSEWYGTMEGFGFIFIALIKLREKIIERNLGGFAFVSRRIMMNLRDTYKVYRDVLDKTKGKNPYAIVPKHAKSVIDGIDTFLSLFKSDARVILKEAMDYDNWVKLAKEKDKMDITQLDTPDELQQIEQMIARNQRDIRNSLSGL